MQSDRPLEQVQKGVAEVTRRRDAHLATAARHQATIQQIKRMVVGLPPLATDGAIVLVQGHDASGTRSAIAGIEKRLDAIQDMLRVLLPTAAGVAEIDTAIVADADAAGQDEEVPVFLQSVLDPSSRRAADLPMEASPEVIRLFADLDIDTPPEKSSSAPSPGTTALQGFGVAIGAPKNGSVEVLGVLVPVSGIDKIEQVAIEARKAIDSNETSATPVKGWWRVKWRQMLWRALVDQREAPVLTASRASLAKAMPAAASKLVDTVQALRLTPSSVDLPAPPPAEEMQVLIRDLLAAEFPTGATIAQIVTSMAKVYHVSAKKPAYWWHLMKAGPFELNGSNEIWRIRQAA